MSVKNDAIADVIAITINDLPKQYFEPMWTNQNYEFCSIYANDAVTIDGGNQIERKVMFDNTGNAKYRRMYDTDQPNVGDVLSTITVPWTLVGTNYSWDKFELLQNKNSAKGFISLIKVRRLDGLWALADLIEEAAWQAPTSATDDLNPYGVPYYLNMFTADSTINTGEGFVGDFIKFRDGTFSSTCAGIDAATNDKWKNYAAVYTNVDNALLKTLRLAFMKTRFTVPLIINDPQQKYTARKRFYTGFDTVADLMNLADQRDDKISGKDVMGNLQVDDGGLVTINRLPVMPIPQLEGADFSPIYCINFSKFQPIVHDGYWMEEGEPVTDRGQHTTFTVFLDGAHNNLCTNRREAGFVVHKIV